MNPQMPLKIHEVGVIPCITKTMMGCCMHLRRDTNFTRLFLYPTWILKYLYFHQLLIWHFQVTLQSHDVLVKKLKWHGFQKKNWSPFPESSLDSRQSHIPKEQQPMASQDLRLEQPCLPKSGNPLTTFQSPPDVIGSLQINVCLDFNHQHPCEFSVEFKCHRFRDVLRIVGQDRGRGPNRSFCR